MTAGMDDAIHVQVKVIKLHPVGVFLAGIHWDLLSFHNIGLKNNAKYQI